MLIASDDHIEIESYVQIDLDSHQGRIGAVDVERHLNICRQHDGGRPSFREGRPKYYASPSRTEVRGSAKLVEELRCFYRRLG